jgi:YbbR domain-containing protein
MTLEHKALDKNKSFWDLNKLKIVSTLVAILIWFLIVAGETYDYVTEVPIEIIPVEKDCIITSRPPSRAKISLRGPGRLLFSFMLFREGSLRLNISPEIGTQTIRPSDDDILLAGSAKNLTYRLIWPDTISVQVEKLVTRDVPIYSHIILKPMAGYTIVGKPTLTPNVVKVRGPQSVVSTMDSAHTQTALFDELRFPFEKKISLSPPVAQNVVWLTTEITVNADVQKLMEKTISDIPVTVRNLPQSVDAFVIPSELSLVVEGGVNVIYSLSLKSIHAYIEYDKRLDGLTEECPVIIEPLPGVRFRDIKPDRFKVVLQHQRAE